MPASPAILFFVNSSFQCLAVIVTYNPEIKLLQELLLRLQEQVDAILIIDNCSESNRPSNDCLNLSNKTTLLYLESNFGLGYAHNLAIEKVKNEQYSHLLILDQDSLPALDMVEKLHQSETQLLENGKKIAAVGPQFISKHEQTKKAFVCDNAGLFYQQQYCSADEIIPTVHLISSGSLIRADILFQEKMEEELFIEFIDVEWALRLRAKGYFSYACCSAIMEQRLGERILKLPFSNSKIVVYKPLRYYYQFRNSLLLYARPYIPLKWCLYHALRHIVIKGIVLILFANNRRENLKYSLLGLWHGMMRRNGAFEKTNVEIS